MRRGLGGRRHPSRHNISVLKTKAGACSKRNASGRDARG